MNENKTLGWFDSLVGAAKPFTDGLLKKDDKPAPARPAAPAPAAKTNFTPFIYGGIALAVVIVLVFAMKGRKSA